MGFHSLHVRTVPARFVCNYNGYSILCVVSMPTCMEGCAICSILLSFQGMQYEMHTKSTFHHVIHVICIVDTTTSVWLSGCLKCASISHDEMYQISVCFWAHINRRSPEKLVHEGGEPLHSKIRWHDPILQGLAEFSQVSQPTWQMNNPVHTTQRNWQRCVDTWYQHDWIWYPWQIDIVCIRKLGDRPNQT